MEFAEVVQEVSFFLQSGEINPANTDYLATLIDRHGGEHAHPVFQDATEQIRVIDGDTFDQAG